jgi:hypothetical protein
MQKDIRLLAADWQQTTRCKIGRYKQVFQVLADRDSFFKKTFDNNKNNKRTRERKALGMISRLTLPTQFVREGRDRSRQ